MDSLSSHEKTLPCADTCAQSYHIRSLGEPKCHPACRPAHKVEVKEGGVPSVGINSHEVVAGVFWVTATGVSIAETILTGISGLQIIIMYQ